MSEETIRIFDTTLRDGEQSPGCSMKLSEKLALGRQLEKLGVDIIEAGFPIASDGDFESVRAISQEIRETSVAGLARTSSADIETALELYPGPAELGGGVAPAEGLAGVQSRVVKYLFFPVLAFTPLFVIICMLYFSDAFQKFLLHPPWGFDTGDMILSLSLLWGLWALLVYEVDGILVNPEHREAG